MDRLLILTHVRAMEQNSCSIGFGVLASRCSELKKKLSNLLAVEVNEYNLLGVLFTIGTYTWDGLCLVNVFYLVDSRGIDSYPVNCAISASQCTRQ